MPFAQNGADARAEIRNRITELPLVLTTIRGIAAMRLRMRGKLTTHGMR